MRIAEPVRRRVLADTLRLLYASILVLSVASMAFLPRVEPPWLDVVARVAGALAAQLAVLALLRQIVPRPPVGLHRVGKSSEHLVWLLSAALAEVAMARLFRAPFWLLGTTRCLYLRALGGDISWSAAIHPDVVVRDPALVSVGAAARVEPGTCLETVVHAAGRVCVGKVSIGASANLGQHVVILPGASLAHEVRVGPSAIVGVDARVGVGVSIGARAVIGDRAELGAYSIVGSGAIVAEGARVGDRARVMAGAVVPPGTFVMERGVWPPGATEPLSEAEQETMNLREVHDQGVSEKP